MAYRPCMYLGHKLTILFRRHLATAEASAVHFWLYNWTNHTSSRHVARWALQARGAMVRAFFQAGAKVVLSPIAYEARVDGGGNARQLTIPTVFDRFQPAKGPAAGPAAQRFLYAVNSAMC